MAASKTPTASDLKAQLDALQAQYAEAQRAETEAQQAQRFEAITEHMTMVSQAVEARDPQAVRESVASLATFTKANFGATRKASTGNGTTERASHDGPPLRDLIKKYLEEHDGPQTAGTIGRDLNRSPGGITAALDRPETGMVAKAEAVLVPDSKPRAYTAV